MWRVGVDPGRSGAAVALAPDGYAEVLWSWRTSPAGILVRIAQADDEGTLTRAQRVGSPFSLGQVIAAGILAVAGSERVLLTHESIHIGKNAATGIEQALWLGRMIGPVEDVVRSKARVLRPKEWRKAVGVDPALRGAEVKQAAAQVVRATVPGLGTLVDALGRKSVMAHDFEAGGIAWAGSKS